MLALILRDSGGTDVQRKQEKENPRVSLYVYVMCFFCMRLHKNLDFMQYLLETVRRSIDGFPVNFKDLTNKILPIEDVFFHMGV